MKKNAWQREEESSRLQVQCIKKTLPQGPAAQPRNMDYPTSKCLRLSKESEESRDEATQVDMELYQSQCGSRWELFCIESGCWLVASGDHRVKEWCGQISSFADEASWAVDHYLILWRKTWREPARRALQQSTRGNKRKKWVLVASKERYCWIEVICLIPS